MHEGDSDVLQIDFVTVDIWLSFLGLCFLIYKTGLIAFASEAPKHGIMQD